MNSINQLSHKYPISHIPNIPTKMYFLSNTMENFALDMEISNYGTAQERTRVAEYNNMQKVFLCIKNNVQCNVNLCNYIVCKCFLFENFAYLFVICITSII